MQNFLISLEPYLIEILATILTTVASFIGMKLKTIFEEKINTETKEKIVKTVCAAIEQLYQDLSGPEKLEKAKENIIAMVKEKGITITELELNMLIESTVNCFKKATENTP